MQLLLPNGQVDFYDPFDRLPNRIITCYIKIKFFFNGLLYLVTKTFSKM